MLPSVEKGRVSPYPLRVNREEEKVFMLWEKKNKFWKTGLLENLKNILMPSDKNKVKNRKYLFFRMISIMPFILAGCNYETPEIPDFENTQKDSRAYSFAGQDNVNENLILSGAYHNKDSVNAQNIGEMVRDIYDEAVNTNTLGSLAIMQRMVVRLGENGYVAVDSENQVNMTEANQVLKFCEIVDEKGNGELTIIVITEPGFQKFDLKTENGDVNVVREYYQYDHNGRLQNISTVSYLADFWQYTEEGYLIFEGSYFSEESFALTLSDTSEHTMLRVLPLDEKCREWNRTCILPVGYEQNNLFLCNWSEEDFGDLDFYDLFDRFYPMIYAQPVPFMTDENSGVGTVYQIPEDLFETVIRTHFHVSSETLHSKTTYMPELAAYEYRPRGFYEAQYPDIAYPEVVSYKENEDGTIALGINAVYPNGNTSKEFSHITVIRPRNEDGFWYVSNEIVSSFSSENQEEDVEGILPEDYDIWWHTNRLTEEEWKKAYGGNP